MDYIIESLNQLPHDVLIILGAAVAVASALMMLALVNAIAYLERQTNYRRPLELRGPPLSLPDEGFFVTSGMALVNSWVLSEAEHYYSVVNDQMELGNLMALYLDGSIDYRELVAEFRAGVSDHADRKRR